MRQDGGGRLEVAQCKMRNADEGLDGRKAEIRGTGLEFWSWHTGVVIGVGI